MALEVFDGDSSVGNTRTTTTTRLSSTSTSTSSFSSTTEPPIISVSAVSAVQNIQSMTSSCPASPNNDAGIPLERARIRVQAKKERFQQLMNSSISKTNSLGKAEESKRLKVQLRNLALALEEKVLETQVLKKELFTRRRKSSSSGNRDQAINTNTNNIDRSSKIGLYPELEAELIKTKEQLETARGGARQLEDNITELQCTLRQQEEEMQVVRHQRDEQLRTIVGYEIDLETHNLTYTNYVEDQQTLEEDALDEIFDPAGAAAGNAVTKEIAALEAKHECRAQQLISKLLADYAQLDSRYKRDQTETTQRIRKLEVEQNDLNATITLLEQKNQSDEKNTYPFVHNNEFNKHSPSSSKFFVKRIDQLERTTLQLRESEWGLKTQVQELQDEKVQWLATTTNISTPEQADDDGESSSSSPETGTLSLSVDDLLLKRIKEQHRRIANLTTENERQSRKIASLRVEAVNYQLRNPPIQLDNYEDDEGSFVFNGKGISWSKEDAKSGISGDTFNMAEEEESLETTSRHELRQQLQDMQQILCRKDQEIATERQRFAEREAALLAQLKDAADTNKSSNHSLRLLEASGQQQFFL